MRFRTSWSDVVTLHARITGPMWHPCMRCLHTCLCTAKQRYGAADPLLDAPAPRHRRAVTTWTCALTRVQTYVRHALHATGRLSSRRLFFIFCVPHADLRAVDTPVGDADTECGHAATVRDSCGASRSFNSPAARHRRTVPAAAP